MISRAAVLCFCLVSLPALASAGDRKEVATRVDCSITVGDRDDSTATDLVIATCPSWPVAFAKIKPVITAGHTHDQIMESVSSAEKLADGRVLQVHVASGISDRQATLSFTPETLADGGYRVSWSLSSKQEPLGDDRVAVAVDDGSWAIWDNGDGTTKVVYSLRYGAGGKVPSFLVRSFQKTSIGEMLEEMRTYVSR